MTTQTQDHAPEATEENPETSPAETTGADKVKVRRPGWKKDPTPSPEATSPEAETADGSDADGAFPGMSDQLPDDKPTKTGSSRTSSRAEREGLRKAVKVAAAGATSGAHMLLVHDPHSQYVGLLLADEEDLDAISEPAGNLLARRMGDVPLGGDLGDVVELIVAAAGYVLKQAGKWAAARQLRQQGAVVGDGFQPDLSQPEPAPETDPAVAPFL